MIIRNAENKDIDAVSALLSQVLELHAKIRPDVFMSGTTKYSREELADIFADESRRTFVAEENGRVLGYAFCIVKMPSFASTMKPRKALFIDDLCVDEAARGKAVGRRLFDFAKEQARRLGCCEITLNVWEGNDGAKAFYEKMGMKPRETQMELIL